MFSSRGGRPARNGRTGQRGNAGALSHPPQIHPAISGSKIFRFICTTNPEAEATVTQANLLQMLVVANTSSTSSLLFSSIRLRKVEAWASPVQGSAPSYVSVTGSRSGPENRKSDYSTGVTPAHVKWNPAPNSLSDLWYHADTIGSDTLLTISCPVTAIVDVAVDFIIACKDTAVAGPIPAGATAGTVYGVPLDGLGGNLLPADYVLLP